MQSRNGSSTGSEGSRAQTSNFQCERDGDEDRLQLYGDPPSRRAQTSDHHGSQENGQRLSACTEMNSASDNDNGVNDSDVNSSQVEVPPGFETPYAHIRQEAFRRVEAYLQDQLGRMATDTPDHSPCHCLDLSGNTVRLIGRVERGNRNISDERYAFCIIPKIRATVALINQYK